MGDKNSTHAQIERLIEMANELEKRELALDQETKHLEQLRTSLDEREQRLSVAAAKAEQVASPEKPVKIKSDILQSERPLAAAQPLKPAGEPQATPPEKPKAPIVKKAESSIQTVSEINDILKSIFQDYSNSVYQISAQMSTVTAAMMCAAVTCVLENQGLGAKDVFMKEMENLLQNGGLGTVCASPSVKPQPATKPQAAAPDAEAGADEEADTEQTEETPPPQRSEDGVLRIASAAEFRKLGEYGCRNDDKLVRVYIPEGVQQLPGSFFYGCRSLEEVTLPASLLEIGPYAFYGCEKLRSVQIAENSRLQEIGEYAFAMCSALETFEVPSTVETLGTSVFRFCSSLAKLKFAKDGSLRHIGSHLLQNCTSLEKLRLPDGITMIPTSMFYGCAAIKKVVAKGVDTIEDYAFYGNEALRTIRIRMKKSIAEQAFEGCNPELEIEYLNY